MPPTSRAEMVRRGVLFSRAAGLAAVLVGCIVIFGWALDVPVLTSIVPGYVTMKPNTAVGFILCGLSLWVSSGGAVPRGVNGSSAAIACSVVAALIGILTLSEYAFDLNLGIDRLLFANATDVVQTSHPGRPSPATAFTFLLLGTGLVVVDRESPRGLRPAEFLALGVLLSGLVALLGYAYGVQSLYRFYFYTSMALHTATLFALLGLGVLFARPDRGWMATLNSPHSGGIAARLMLPFAIGIPFVLGWIRLMGQRAGWYDTEIGLALFATSNIVIFTTVVLVAARVLNRADIRRRGVEGALSDTQQSLQAIIDSAMDAIVTVDSRQRVTLFNHAAERLFLCSAAQALGQPLDRFIPERFRAAHAGHVQAFGETGVTSRSMGQLSPISGLRSDGAEFPIEASISQVKIAGETFFTVILRDVGDRTRMEAALRQSQKMEALGALAGGIAHDFNNILAAILGHAELALDELAADHPSRESLSQIRAASSRGGELIAQILGFSRNQPSQRVVLQLKPVIVETLKLLRASLPTSIDIQTDFGARSLPAVWADGTQIHQIVMNLGTNAAHALRGQRAGLLKVSLESTHVDADAARRSPDLKEGDYVTLTVTDNGCGMDEAVRIRIFEPLFTTKPKGEGTGLGLSTVYGIMKGNGGAITVHSQPGKGTTFRLYFPAAGEVAAQSAAPARLADAGSGERIMVVDDDPVLMLMITRILQRLDYQPTGYADVSKALAAIREKPRAFDAIITDLSMPAMSGLDFAREVLRIRPGFPIVISSGQISSEDRESAGQVGVREMIQKPYSREKLAESLRKVLPERTQPNQR